MFGTEGTIGHTRRSISNLETSSTGSRPKVW
jgi:hypothetical protein